MNDTRFERDLSTWLSETAMPRMPDYADEILDETARLRQRPRWTFVRRWLPIPELPWGSMLGQRATAALLLLLLAVLLAALAAFAASRRTALPPPFGLAGNGLLASSLEGDIVLVDTKTGSTHTIVAGDTVDEHPRWSLDGTRIAFLRQTDYGAAVVVTAVHGRILAVTDPFRFLDSDSLRWSPDGRRIAFGGDTHLGHGIHIVDVATGATRLLTTRYIDGELFWRPGNEPEIAIESGEIGGGIGIVNVDTGDVIRVPTGNHNQYMLRLLGWTPDGARILFQEDRYADDDHSPEKDRTGVVDAHTGALIHLDVAYGHVSNDGSRVAGIRTDANGLGIVCVVPITGGTCEPVPGSVEVEGPHGAAISWSPDDRWIAILGQTTWLVDPTGREAARELPADGPGSWQRLAP